MNEFSMKKEMMNFNPNMNVNIFRNNAESFHQQPSPVSLHSIIENLRSLYTCK